VITVCTATIAGREEMLAECVESVKQQTLTVADHLILLDTERKGGAWTKQQLLEQVKTEWCILLDDDDLIDPDYCKRLTDEAGDADVIYGWCRSDIGFDNYNTHFSDSRLAIGESVVPHCAMFKTEAARAVGGVPQIEGYDLAMWRKMLANGSKFKSVPETLWTYRLSPKWWHESRP